MTTTTIHHPTNRPNFAIVTIGVGRNHALAREDLTLAYSYETCIGFRVNYRWILTVNYWGPTTGKHLNYLRTYVNNNDDKRLDAKQFAAALATYLETTDATVEVQL